jgi:hypothetical protein
MHFSINANMPYAQLRFKMSSTFSFSTACCRALARFLALTIAYRAGKLSPPRSREWILPLPGISAHYASPHRQTTSQRPSQHASSRAASGLSSTPPVVTQRLQSRRDARYRVTSSILYVRVERLFPTRTANGVLGRL